MIQVPDYAFDEYCQFFEQRDAIYFARHQAGESYQSIANDAGVTRARIQELVRGWPRNKRKIEILQAILERQRLGENYAQIAKALSIDVERIERLEENWRNGWLHRSRHWHKKNSVEYGYA